MFAFQLEGSGSWDTPEMRNLPVSYKGRIRPLDAYARLWLQDFYGAEEISSEHLAGFHLPEGSALELMWQMHFLGHAPWDDAPLFHIKSPVLKKSLNLAEKSFYFSFNDLSRAIYKTKSTNIQFIKPILMHYFWLSYQSPLNRSKSPKQELKSLAPGLWLLLKDNQLIVVDYVSRIPWNFLEKGMVLVENISDVEIASSKKSAEEATKLLSEMIFYKQIAGVNSTADAEFVKKFDLLTKSSLSSEKIGNELAAYYPLHERLQSADVLLPILPGKQGLGLWMPLKSLKLQVYNPQNRKLELISNFTFYSDALFSQLQATYQALEQAVMRQDKRAITQFSEQLVAQLNEGYQSLEGTLALEASGKVITYPSKIKLQAEVLYYRLPSAKIIFALYIMAIFVFILSFFWKRKLCAQTAVALVFTAFVMHTGLLFLRSYILNRPPVSNMFETVVYVPWITVLASLLLYMKLRYRFLLIASSLAACILLFLLQATALHHELENVQPVLDSQYWLIIHVLLVVGSYGIFALSGILGHFYLLYFAVRKTETAAMRFLGKCILQSLYIGIFMLIPGTILGGVWAAESWGRFWDWDPKESWAFISISLYLIGIHLYRHGRIRNFGLAMGAVGGFLAISFTWYGVNYILGTGLHSYGFGSGGELYYYLFLLGEALFISYVSYVGYAYRISASMKNN